MGFLNFTKTLKVGYGRFPRLLRGFFVDFLWVFA